ncbi:MAG TPA: bi-domain-containing oxidoreductase [Longimicrobium sp.]|jgi:predicted dehydrogenase/threonine dehydrogenase-like Zn-dependent dehydrogenase|uniref:bi-domain-containing oxidoreductase n=1 Tax=Longimicrobium sp. TaxID=2029185 RepID=UPI002EDA00B6
MKQLLQQLNTGETRLVDVPVPRAGGNTLVVETRATLVSAGTERMLVEFGRANLLDKARSQPDKVKQVLDKVRTDGLAPTLEAVRAKLDAPIPLGYCQAGVVVEAGPGAGGFRAGDRVVTNGSHAEYVRVPHTLAARVPQGVTDEAAAFTPLAAIGLQGIRLAAPTLGETVVVYGLGLIGLLTVQLLRANGCRVIGIDRDPGRLALAGRFGAVALDGAAGSVSDAVLAQTGGVGADAVLLTLASDSDDPVHQAAAMARKRGRLVLVGVTGLNLRRDDFYRKELSFAVSCSYGPGRYDPSYEEGGQDYPLPFVRWTEQRNFEAVLQLMADGALDPLSLVTHRFPFDRAPDAYEVISGGEPSLGVVLTYPDRGGVLPRPAERVLVPAAALTGAASTGVVGLIGAGNFAVRTLLPALRETGARLHTIASSGGTSGAVAGEKFGFERVTTDVDALLATPEIDTVFVLTRHDSHAGLAERALAAGKNVFVEKPLALREDELDALAARVAESGKLLTVGFNRRFAPLAAEAAGLLRGRAGPVSIVATVNAGMIPRDHWTQDPRTGGGRITGEACHFMDLCRFLAGAPIADVRVTPARGADGRPIDDIAHLSMAFADGSTAVVHYLSSGARSYPKERIECFWDGKTVAIDNWRRLQRFGVPGPWWERGRAMDKGHAEELRVWMDAVRGGGAPPIPLDQVWEVSRWAILAGRMARDAG